MVRDAFGDMDDPLERLDRNERQAGQAVRFVLLSFIAVVVLAVASVVLFDITGDECPDTGGLCLTRMRVEVVLLPTLVSLALTITSAVTTYRRWRNHIRWRPWLFATYVMWIGTTGYLLVSASAVFANVR